MIWLMPTTRDGTPAAVCFHLFTEHKSLCGDWVRQPRFNHSLDNTTMRDPRLCLTCKRRLKHRPAESIVWEESP